jgi:hypothetical protein
VSTLTVAIIAGLTGLLATFISAWVAWKVAGKTADSTWSVAREERRQDRIRDAYITIQLYISKWARVAEWYASTIRTSDNPEPTLPSVSEEAEALASLMSSSVIVNAIAEFDTRMRRFRFRVGDLEVAVDAMKVNPGAFPTGVLAQTTSVRESAASLIEQAGVVNKMMRQELGTE